MENPTSAPARKPDQQLGLDTLIEGVKSQRNESLDLAAHLNAELAVTRRALEEALEAKKKAVELAKTFREAGREMLSLLAKLEEDDSLDCYRWREIFKPQDQNDQG